MKWAGFKEIKKTFEKRIERSIRIPNSSLVLNWGEYGSGKTHAARYFNKKDVLKDLADGVDRPVPYSMVISLPKGKDPIFSLYTSIVDKLNIEELRTIYLDINPQIVEYISSISSNIHIQNVLKGIFNSEINHLDVCNGFEIFK